jgi:kinesin family protein 6/9
MPRSDDDDGSGEDEDPEPPSSSSIQIFMRVRPTKKPSGYFELNESTGKVSFDVPKDMVNNMVNNSRTNWDFRYDGIIGMDSTQEEVFEKVAVPVNQSALDGYNATIFAYGQTGSGKTFTITGGVERYVDRGIIPRTLSWFYQKFQENSDIKFEMRISYLEIYNEAGYDLLVDDESRKSHDQLPKVTMMEDENGEVEMRNLSQHIAASEEVCGHSYSCTCSLKLVAIVS